MIDSVLTFTLHAVSRRGQGKVDVFQTVFVQGRTATATIALSAFTNGEENGRLGAATAIITKAGVVTAPGRTDTLPLDPIDILRNQILIPACSFVTFRMGVEMAEAIAVATVFVEGGGMKLAARSSAAWIADKASGRVTGLHRIAFPAGATRPSEALVLRRVRECAALASGVHVRSVVTATASRPPKVVATGLVLDPRTGRARSAAPARGPEPSALRSVFRGD
jgi:hypothetical protein